jgi:ABC-2 type transport system ATP-binding protein
MRRRLDLARALIHSPTLLLLDEPTVGLDLHAHERFWRRLLALKSSEGLAILVTTHRADEAERCDRVIIMDRGRIVDADTPANLLARVAGDVITMAAEEPKQLAADILEYLQLPAQCVGGQVVLQQENGHELVPKLVEAVGAARLQAISVHRPTLADAFFEITGRALDSDEDAP